MPSLCRSLLPMLAVVLACASPALALDKTFSSPKLKGNRLDWCRVWAAECGQPAADAFCQSKGYDKAKTFKKDSNVGAQSPTRLIGAPAQVCSDANCDSFAFITCTKSDLGQSFKNPKLQGDRLDWCINWAAQCGKPAADAFCKSKGFDHATSFEKDPDIGADSPTRLIGNPAQVCSDAMCDGFSKITCAD